MSNKGPTLPPEAGPPEDDEATIERTLLGDDATSEARPVAGDSETLVSRDRRTAQELAHRTGPVSEDDTAGVFEAVHVTPAATAKVEHDRLYRSALLDDERSGHFAGGLALAALLHAAVLGAALLLPKLFARPPPLRKPIIASLVAKGKPRDPKMMPRKEAPPPAGGAPPVRNPPPAKAPPAKTVPQRPATATGKTVPQRAPTRQELMQRALASAAGHAAKEPREAPDPERAGQADGSDTGTAETAEAGDRYFTEVHDRIAENYVVPSVISERERLYLSATVVAYIAANGTIVKHEFEKKSGNHFFDEALEVAIQRTRLPPPPPELSRQLRDQGVALNFKP